MSAARFQTGGSASVIFYVRPEVGQVFDLTET
jgi:hypothetical protein